MQVLEGNTEHPREGWGEGSITEQLEESQQGMRGVEVRGLVIVSGGCYLYICRLERSECGSLSPMTGR